MRINRIIVLILIFVLAAGAAAFYLPTTVSAQDLNPQIGESVFEEIFDLSVTPDGADLDFSGCIRKNTAPLNFDFEQRVVELVNIERANAGLSPLKRNSELDFAARDHARDLVEDDYFAHDTMDRVDGNLTRVCGPFDRIRLYYSGYSAAGENIGGGYSTPEAVVKGWMDSPGHRGNILNDKYREIGIGYYSGNATFPHYWVQDFGAKPDVYPVVINNENLQTASPNVNLYLYGQGVWDEMRINTNNNGWSNWIPFQPQTGWSLAPTNGTQTLSVEYRILGQNSAGAMSSDSITLANYKMVDMSFKVFIPSIVR